MFQAETLIDSARQLYVRLVQNLLDGRTPQHFNLLRFTNVQRDPGVLVPIKSLLTGTIVELFYLHHRPVLRQAAGRLHMKPRSRRVLRQRGHVLSAQVHTRVHVTKRCQVQPSPEAVIVSFGLGSRQLSSPERHAGRYNQLCSLRMTVPAQARICVHVLLDSTYSLLNLTFHNFSQL